MKIQPNNVILSNEQIRDVVAFSETIRKIHARLIAQGYLIKNGKIIPPMKKSDNMDV